MVTEVEPAKKVLLPYLQRADELQKHEPLVAYYCRLYGMERGLKIPPKERTKTTNAILISLMNQLEKDKKSVQLSPEDNLYVEGFALNVFAKADKQDRAGRADLNTAKTFYAASIFIEILHQFGPLQPDIEQKQKYAVWKAADIRKALSEGRKPVPGPPGGEEELSISPHGASDVVVSPTGVQEGRPFVQQAPIMGFKTLNSSLDGGTKVVSGQGPQPDDYDHYSSVSEHGMQQQWPLDFTSSGQSNSGFTSPYPGSYHPPPSVLPDTSSSSSSLAASPHRSMPQPDVYNSQPHTVHYPEYSQMGASGPTYPSAPTTYMGNNGASDAAYYHSQGHVPGTMAYPAPASDYSSYATSNDPSGLGRTSSAPISSTTAHTFQPTPEKIAEAQKAARFAVSALAFDDVPTAVSYLKQSLELLTNLSSV